MCETCGSRLAPSAEFCSNCGEERAGYAQRRFAQVSGASRSLLGEAAARPHPAIGLLASASASALAALPWALLALGAESFRVPASFAAGLAILAIACRERETVARLLGTGSLSSWTVAILGTGGFLAAGFLLRPLLPTVLRPPPLAQSGLHPVTAALSLALLPAALEEIAFRGLLLENLRGLLPAGAAHALTAAASAAILCRPEAVANLFLFSLFLGWLRGRGGSLLPPMAAHAAFNLGLAFLARP
jgi:membrane protease YdiL (CAAX protease family)